MLGWQVESQQPLQHQEEAMVVEEELQLRWQRGREGWWRKQWTRPHFNESAPRFRDRKQEARMLNCHRRVMCEAAKKSLKEKKLHIGPWKKSRFMQLKWSGFNQTLTLANSMGDIPANEPYLRISGAPTVLVT
ncbi:uncharacterized protein LOC107494965 [Arachis duranensis]|uniref:Uncharacterized protein LOC107494965 n=1 Tax=Arachis duranensis TaxID=130453 RepID=A0A6P4DZD8_ARADU|nr:uncharacterized protein LOC107494965 [Arachis duranensis]